MLAPGANSGPRRRGQYQRSAGKINSDFEVNGFATTTAASGNFATEGTISVASSSPAVQLNVTGDTYLDSTATTTLHVKSTGATQGGCIELEGADDTIYAVTVATNGTSLEVKAGVCQ